MKVKRLLTALLLTATCTAQAVPRMPLQPLPGVALDVQITVVPGSVSNLPDTLFGQPVLAWRWLPDPKTNDGGMPPVAGVRLPADDRVAEDSVGLEALMAEQSPETQATCEAVTKGTFGTVPHGYHHVIQCNKRYVWVTVYWGGTP